MSNKGYLSIGSSIVLIPLLINTKAREKHAGFILIDMFTRHFSAINRHFAATILAAKCPAAKCPAVKSHTPKNVVHKS